MEKKSISPRANRILYTVVVAVLCAVAVIIGIVAAANRPIDGTTPPTGPSTTVTAPDNTKPSQPTGSGEGEDDAPVFLCPLSGHVSKPHDVENLSYSPSMGDWRTHAGLDITASLGDTVAVAAAGTVEEVWEDALMGTCVTVLHEDDIRTVYKNLDATLADGISVGAAVKAGDALGTVGETAFAEIAEEPHLHFEMTVGGEVVDPLSYLSEDSKSASLTFGDEVYED